MTMFRDRGEGGRQLARELELLRPEHPIVLALPSGGVPVGFELALALGATLDVLLVRSDGSVRRGFRPPPAGSVLSEGALAEARLGADLREMAARQPADLARRVRAELPAPQLSPIAGRTVIIVDDLLATGERACAAALIARRRGASRVVVATPVLGRVAERVLRPVTDEIHCVYSTPTTPTLRDWYERADAVSDDAVISFLGRARRARAPGCAEDSAAWSGGWSGTAPGTHPRDDARHDAR